MITRLLTLIVIVTLALPITTITPLGDPGPGSWSEVAMAAKGKHKKKAKKKDTTPVTTPQFTTVTHPGRGSVTQTFSSTGSIAVPKDGSSSDKGPAGPYSSTVEVSGFTSGVITDVDLVLFDVTHVQPEDIDILLAKDDGRRALVMSDVGRNNAVSNIDLTLDDEAAVSMPASTFAPRSTAGHSGPRTLLNPASTRTPLLAPR